MNTVKIRTCFVLFVLLGMVLSYSPLSVAQSTTMHHPRSIFHLQYVFTISWSENQTDIPISNGETREVNITITYSVLYGAYQKFLLRLLEGRSFTIHISSVNTPNWCESWFSPDNLSGLVQTDESEDESTSLFIHVNDDAPGNYSLGWVMACASVESMKGPFHILTFIHGFEQNFTIPFTNN
jgi:hypothetical protein